MVCPFNNTGEERTSKTICLAVTPSLKKYGLSGRSRLFEVEQKVSEVEKTTGRLKVIRHRL